MFMTHDNLSWLIIPGIYMILLIGVIIIIFIKNDHRIIPETFMNSSEIEARKNPRNDCIATFFGQANRVYTPYWTLNISEIAGLSLTTKPNDFPLIETIDQLVLVDERVMIGEGLYKFTKTSLELECNITSTINSKLTLSIPNLNNINFHKFVLLRPCAIRIYNGLFRILWKEGSISSEAPTFDVEVVSISEKMTSNGAPNVQLPIRANQVQIYWMSDQLGLDRKNDKSPIITIAASTKQAFAGKLNGTGTTLDIAYENALLNVTLISDGNSVSSNIKIDSIEPNAKVVVMWLTNLLVVCSMSSSKRYTFQHIPINDTKLHCSIRDPVMSSTKGDISFSTLIPNLWLMWTSNADIGEKCNTTLCCNIINDYINKKWAYTSSNFSECRGCDIVTNPNRIPGCSNVTAPVVGAVAQAGVQGGGTLYTFSSHTFTNAGATGRNGPTLPACRIAYSSAPWANTFLNMATQGIQLWTVPETARYIIKAVGASGGRGPIYSGGYGAICTGTFDLVKGEVLKILVGQSGLNRSGIGSNISEGSGGGGTFVARINDTPLIVAGGGGGSGSTANGANASTSTTGVSGGGNGGNGGIDGGGGGGATSGTPGKGRTVGGTGSSCSYGSGGGGFYSRGGYNCGGGSPQINGSSFLEGGRGGAADTSRAGVEGGFGGGAGVGHRSPGGGGYSGGGGDGGTTGGGGGGSYNSGRNQSNGVSSQTGHGLVTITKL